MKFYQITYWKMPPISVMTYWVHKPLDGESLNTATVFDPPRPGPVPGEGWPVLMVEIDGVELVFTSLAELDTYVEVMSRQPLPTTMALSRERPIGPNTHWLSRMPKKAKSTKHRDKAIKYLREIRGAFAAVAERPS